jgi:hypothetical protein
MITSTLIVRVEELIRRAEALGKDGASERSRPGSTLHYMNERPTVS